MLRAYTTLTTLATLTRQRLTARRDDDAGFSTLEWVIIVVGVLGLAVGAVAAVTAVVTRYQNQIR